MHNCVVSMLRENSVPRTHYPPTAHKILKADFLHIFSVRRIICHFLVYLKEQRPGAKDSSATLWIIFAFES